MESKRYPERHWTYDAQEEPTRMPSFMNDGYAPPDWTIIESVEVTEPPSSSPPLSRS